MEGLYITLYIRPKGGVAVDCYGQGGSGLFLCIDGSINFGLFICEAFGLSGNFWRLVDMM